MRNWQTAGWSTADGRGHHKDKEDPKRPAMPYPNDVVDERSDEHRVELEVVVLQDVLRQDKSKGQQQLQKLLSASTQYKQSGDNYRRREE